MEISTLRSFFLWCTILNLGVLILTSLLLTIGGDLVYSMQGSFFSISRETFDTVIYCWNALYRIVFIAFNLVPWMALKIIA